MIFINNKYTAIYYKIVDRANHRTLPKDLYKERHHIVPKSLGGNNTKENMVSLTGREHLICHLLLIRMTIGASKASMVSAAWSMANLENKGQQRVRLGSRQYAVLREQFSAAHSVRMSNNNPMSDPTVRQKYDIAIINRGKTPGMTGKKHTDESNIKRRIANTGQVVPLEKRQAASEFHSNRPAELKAKYDQVHSSSICCIFCHRTSNPGTFKRWHGDNCKTNNCLIR
jgi:hypothetical protein